MTAPIPSILVIDDEPGIREMLAFELSLDGFDVETAETGFAAVDALRRRRFDLAITDLKMPGMDGAATLQSLREVDPGIEVIVATGYASVETAVDCMRRGAYDYILKPYDMGQLKLLLQRALQKSHLQGMVALYEASRALLVTLDHGEMVEHILSLAVRALRADEVGLVLARGGGDQELDVHCRASDTGPPVALLIELAREVIETRAPRLIPSANAMPAAAGDDGARASALVFPLVARDRMRGTLVVLRRAASPGFSQSELERGTVLSGQVALALDNARLHDELANRLSELERTREQLVMAEKMSLAGRLAGAVAHEVNNPLAIVGANLEALRDYSATVQRLWLAARSAAAYLEARPEEAARAHAVTLRCAGGDEQTTAYVVPEIASIVEETAEGVRRIAQLVTGFTRLASPDAAQKPKPELVDVGELVRECWAGGGGGRPAANLVLDPRPCTSLVDRSDLRTALLNLLAFLDAGEPRDGAGAGHGGATARVEQQDHGPAIILSGVTASALSDSERQRLFEPRVDLDEAGRTLRLDLGLALTYQLLHRNGAEVSTSANGDAGLTVRIQLPA